MQQTFLRFNPERLEQTYSNLILRESTQQYDDYICKRNNNDYQYIARRLKQSNIDNLRFSKLRNIKLYNILPALDIYREEQTLVSQDFEQYSLQNNIDAMDNKDKYLAISLVSITLQELVKRNLPYKVTQKNIIIIDKHVCLQQIDFDFDHIITEKESFQSFIKITQELGIPCDCKDFETATNYYLKKQDIMLGPSDQMPFADFLTNIFDFQDVKSLVEDSCNSYVYTFDTPEFLKIIPGISNKSVLKSTKIDNPDTDQEYLIKCANRELLIMEKFQKFEPFVSCFAYLRVQEQLFIFMELFSCDLKQAFETQCLYDRNIKELCCQLAQAIHRLHSHNIIHRDLKPSNLFLSNEDLDRAQLLIADFDHSTLFEEQNAEDTLISLSPITGLTGSTGYEPPESGLTDYDSKCDIWQIGMIMYQICNQGIHPYKTKQLYWQQSDYEEISKINKIKQNLEEKQIEPKLIEIIASCLSTRSEQRPNSKDLLLMLQDCFEDIELDDDEVLQSTHQIHMVESYGQLLSRSKPLKMMKSSHL